MSRIFKTLFGIAAALGFAACGGAGAPAAKKGGAMVQVSTAALSTNVVEVSLRVWDPAPAVAPGTDLTFRLTKSAAGTFDGVLGGLPTGIALNFDATATATDGTSYTGSAAGNPITLSAGVNAQIVFALQESTPVPSFQNNAPTITGLTATSRFVQPGGGLSITAGATDLDVGDTLTYAWAVTPAAGTLTPAGGTVSWTAPASPGDYTFNVTVTDSKGASAQASLVVTVSTTNSLDNAGIRAILNNAPVVTQVAVAPQYDPARPYPSALTLSVTDDGVDIVTPARPLTFAWTIDASLTNTGLPGDGCAGSFLAADLVTPGSALQNPVFVPSTTAAPVGGVCVLNVTVADALGASNVGTITLAVLPTAQTSLPRLVASFQSAATVPATMPDAATPGATVPGFALLKAAFDLRGTALKSSYSSSDPAITIASGSATDANVVKVSTACAIDPVTLKPTPVTATITAAPLDPAIAMPTAIAGVTKAFTVTFCN